MSDLRRRLLCTSRALLFLSDLENSLMSTKSKKATPQQIKRALASLEILSEKRSQRVLHQLKDGQHKHLPELSTDCGQSPYQTKKQLDRLKGTGVIFSPKRYPAAYAVNEAKVIKIALQVKKVAL